MSPKLTALAEFDLVEAQDFYAPKGAWVAAHFGPIWVTDMPRES